MPKKEALALKVWIRTLPFSQIHYPDAIIDRVKYYFWKVYTPLHPLCRDILLTLRIVKHNGRQRIPLGRLAPGKSMKEFIAYLVSRGYANHFVAWEDEGELVSFRYVVDFNFQYHLRIFMDGEVRGHYEYTPESHPIWHLQEVGFEERRDEFLNLLKEWIVPVRPDAKMKL